MEEEQSIIRIMAIGMAVISKNHDQGEQVTIPKSANRRIRAEIHPQPIK